MCPSSRENAPPNRYRDRLSLDIKRLNTVENLSDYNTNLELTVRASGMLNDVNDRTDLNISEIIRRCIIRQMYSLIQSGLIKEWEKGAVVRTWANLQNEMLVPKSKFQEIIYRRFVMAGPTTRDLIRQDPRPFRDFAVEYHDRLYDSKIYHQMVEEFGPRAFNDLENLIEEIIGLEFDVETTGEPDHRENIFLSE